jgi:hypothetical protein
MIQRYADLEAGPHVVQESIITSFPPLQFLLSIILLPLALLVTENSRRIGLCEYLRLHTAELLELKNDIVKMLDLDEYLSQSERLPVAERVVRSVER